MALSIQDSPDFGPLSGSLLRSRWSIALVLAIAIPVGWFVFRPQLVGGERLFLIATGFLAAVGYFVAAAYGLRKFIHRTPLAFEFARRVSGAALDQAELELGVVRQEVREGRHKSRSAIRGRVKQVLRSHGVSKVLDVRVSKVAGEPGGYLLETLPCDPLGKTARWFEAHFFLGLACPLLVFFHGGGSFDSPMAVGLNVLALLVLISGSVGLYLWIATPRLLTKLESDLSTEESYVLQKSLTRRIRETTGDNDSARSIVDAMLEEKKLTREVAERTRNKLEAAGLAAEAARDLVALAGQRLSIEATARKLERVRKRLVRWKFAHIPPAVLLLSLIVIHVFSVIWY